MGRQIPLVKPRGLLLASASTQTPGVLLQLQRPQHHGDRGPTGHSDKVPVLNESLAQRGTLLIDRECFTQARRSCLKLNTFSWKRTCRRTVSLWRTRVPKPKIGRAHV